MAIVIPNFESVEEKIEWIRGEMIALVQDAQNPALEADRLSLASALNQALAEAGVDTAPPIEKPYIPEVITSPTIVESQ
jgi:hypothetical protein